jgi:hypothetical protein
MASSYLLLRIPLVLLKFAFQKLGSDGRPR